MEIKLERPGTLLVPSYLGFIEEMEKAGEEIWHSFIPTAFEDHGQFAQRVLDYETVDRPHFVRETVYWPTREGEVVGRIALRHSLNEGLKEFGGHIGYEVRPSCRRQGIARDMLRRILETSKAREIGKILLTCAPENIASNKTILANGGVLEKTVFVKERNRQTNYYWINLP